MPNNLYSVAPPAVSLELVHGKYLNTANLSEYIELRTDGTFLVHQTDTQIMGRFELTGEVLVMTLPSGQTTRTIMQPKGFTDQEGRTWVRERAPVTFPTVNNSAVNNYPIGVKNKSTGRSLLVIGIVVVTTVCAFVVGRNVVKRFLPQPYSEANAIWKVQQLPGTPLTLELPGEPKMTPLVLPDEVKRVVVDFRLYEYTASDFSVAMMYASYKEDIAGNAEAGARGAAENLKTVAGVTDLKYTVTSSGSSRALLAGSCKMAGRQSTIDGFIEAEGRRVWGVITIYVQTNSDARSSAKRIIASARIK